MGLRLSPNKIESQTYGPVSQYEKELWYSQAAKPVGNNPVFSPLNKQNQSAVLLLTPSSISAKKFICFGLSSASKTSAVVSGDLASLICFLAARLRNKAVLASCSCKERNENA